MADAMLEDPVLRAQVYLTPEEEDLVQIPTGFRRYCPRRAGQLSHRA